MSLFKVTMRERNSSLNVWLLYTKQHVNEQLKAPIIPISTKRCYECGFRAFYQLAPNSKNRVLELLKVHQQIYVYVYTHTCVNTGNLNITYSC
jgi:hypothetical protein